jgi:hypothetical protein
MEALVKYDEDRVDEMILALLYLTSSHDQYVTRAWKGLPWEAMDQLFKKGYISNPREKSPILVLSAAGARLSKELFFEHFATEAT